jgi:hypothetical protein
VLQKFKGIQLTEDDLKRVLRYVRNEAPIICHASMDRNLQHYIKDTNYRNLFEVSKSSCGARVQWEDRMFNNVYHSAKAFDRVKYGVLNLANDPRGVSSCYGYGDSYFLLDNSVRLRTTFASCDTAADAALLATCEYYAHVLDTYTPEELKNIHLVASGKQMTASSQTHSAYKEVQIHGEFRFNRDVKALMANPKHKGTSLESQILEFGRKNGFPIVWMPSSTKGTNGY